MEITIYVLPTFVLLTFVFVGFLGTFGMFVLSIKMQSKREKSAIYVDTVQIYRHPAQSKAINPRCVHANGAKVQMVQMVQHKKIHASKHKSHTFDGTHDGNPDHG